MAIQEQMTASELLEAVEGLIRARGPDVKLIALSDEGTVLPVYFLNWRSGRDGVAELTFDFDSYYESEEEWSDRMMEREGG